MIYTQVSIVTAWILSAAVWSPGIFFFEYHSDLLEGKVEGQLSPTCHSIWLDFVNCWHESFGYIVRLLTRLTKMDGSARVERIYIHR